MPERRESIGRTLLVAVTVSLVCSVVVSAAAILLEPRRELNRQRAIQEDIVEVAGLRAAHADVADAFAALEPRLVDLASGRYVDADPAAFDMRRASSDPETSIRIPADEDIAQIDRRPRLAKVYLVRDQDRLDAVVLPVHGYGLWSTMYGLVALEADGETIRALKFYEHAETPGLGDQIDDKEWREQFSGKQVYAGDGRVAIEVVKGNVTPGDPLAEHRVDGLSGATLTANGVTNTLRYWLGENGYGPYLARLREQSETAR